MVIMDGEDNEDDVIMKYFNKLIISVITFGLFLILGMLSDNELYGNRGVTWVIIDICKQRRK